MTKKMCTRNSHHIAQCIISNNRHQYCTKSTNITGKNRYSRSNAKYQRSSSWTLKSLTNIITVIQFPLTLLLLLLLISVHTVPLVSGQSFLNSLLPSALRPSDLDENDSLIYTLLADTSRAITNSESLDSAMNFFTIISSFMGPLGSQYSLDFTLASNMNHTYDYVIIGAGSAGATLAARLTEDPEVRVLLLEAGGEEDLINNIPVTAFVLQKTHRDWAYESEPQKRAARGLNRERIPVPRGKLVGGGSSINYMLYVRGNYRDYDRWHKLAGGDWTWADLFPYFVKSEGSRAANTDPGYHGTAGPLTVSPLMTTFPVDEAFLKGVYQAGLKIGDFNGADQERFMYSWYTTRDGKRCSTGRAYLSPASKRPNLNIILFARVTRLIIDSKNMRAIGAEFTKDRRKFQVFVKREVIMSAGAINTPQLLMLSGIGPRQHLESLGIPVIADLPGVGSNLQDHPFTLQMFTAKKYSSFVYARLKMATDLAQYFTLGSGSFASPGLNVIGFYRSKYAADERPDIQIHELDYIPGGAAPNLALGFILNVNREVLTNYMLPHAFSDGVMFAVTLVRPRSKGTVRLASTDPRAAPLIDHNIFADKRDLLAMVEGCKLVLNISETPAMQEIEAKPFTTPLPGCTDYVFNSDDYLACLTQTLTYTLYHPTSTAKMGFPDDPMAVVDNQLRVRGIHGLRIVDASIMPEVPSGNTNAPTIAVAEYAADILKGRKLPRATPPYTDEQSILTYPI